MDLSKELNKKYKQIMKKYDISISNPIQVESVNSYGTEFVDVRKLPFIYGHHEKSEVKISFVSTSEYNRNGYADYEVLQATCMDVSFEIMICHNCCWNKKKYDEETYNLLKHRPKFIVKSLSENIGFTVLTMYSAIELIRSMAFAKHLDYVFLENEEQTDTILDIDLLKHIDCKYRIA